MKSGKYRGAIIDIERRSENVQKWGPLIIYVDGLEDLRNVLQMLRMPDERRRFVAHETAGAWEDIDVVGIDSLQEVTDMLDAALRIEFPEKAGDKSYRRWDEFGTRTVGFLNVCRDLTANDMGAPLGVIITNGLKTMRSPVGEKYYESFIKGNIAGPKAPFKSSYVFRQESVFVDDQVRHLLYTAGEDLKGPGTDVLPPRIDITGDGFVKVWDTLVKHASGE